MSFISVAEAEKVVLENASGYGLERVTIDKAQGRVLAENIVADRDLPPYDRVTMDGIAIRYSAFQRGLRKFRVVATIAAGDAPVDIRDDNECVEIMTGCSLPASVDTVIRYEDISIKDEIAAVTIEQLKKGANIHTRGLDKCQGDIVVRAGTLIDAGVINMAASVGVDSFTVKKLPRVVIVSTGDELVEITEQPKPWQVRRSNVYAIRAVLQQYGIEADLLHISDERRVVNERIKGCIGDYDVVLLSGGVSMGKYDYVPQALEAAGVLKLFHKVRQRPGKPFWFGRASNEGALVFAFPGNPVSAFMCLHRYFVPWLAESSGLTVRSSYAMLNEHVTFVPGLQFFLQVCVRTGEDGVLTATPVSGNGSGDFSSLVSANAFMELPEEKEHFAKGELYRIWTFKNNIL